MNNDSILYNELNRGWKSTCKILFGEEVGELKDYEEWLQEYMPRIGKRKSHVSDKEVTLDLDDYCKGAKIVSLDEVKAKEMEPLNINQIKDIDSIFDALSENWEYTGNKILGNSTFVQNSDIVIDSHYVSDSVSVQQSSYVYASSQLFESNKYIYGSVWTAKCEFHIRCSGGYNVKRCFESGWQSDNSDIYYSFGCYGCRDVLFSFNLRNKDRRIGNLQLTKDKFAELKKKILGELRDELKKEKRLPSIFELVPNEAPEGKKQLFAKTVEEEGERRLIEKAFKTTFKILFKKESGSEVYAYENWLKKHFTRVEEIETAFGSKTYVPRDDLYAKFMLIFPEKRAVSLKESHELAERSLNEKDLTSLTAIRSKLPEICYFNVEIFEGGKNRNYFKSAVTFHSSDIYDVWDANMTEYSAMDLTLVNCKYVFGSNRVVDSQFCINCYNSLNLNRCFEVDSCTKCADSYFCHNCEGLQDAMFCWNTKAKRHAIGNSELPPDKYRSIKESVLAQVSDELVRNKSLKYDIFNIGCGKL